MRVALFGPTEISEPIRKSLKRLGHDVIIMSLPRQSGKTTMRVEKERKPNVWIQQETFVVSEDIKEPFNAPLAKTYGKHSHPWYHKGKY